MLPSFIITGFLGSGKTTLLINSVKDYFHHKKVAVVVNEFGEVGFDGKVLSNVYSQVLELSEGCICCSLSANFEKGIREILDKYRPDVLFVETSGVSEPFPIMLSLQSLGFSVEGVLCVVDSKNFFNYAESTTAKHQIGSSNVIVLNKIDLVSEAELNRVEEAVIQTRKAYSLRNFFTGEEVFPKYLIVKSVRGNVPKEVLQTAHVNLKALQKGEKVEDHLHEDGFYQKTVKFDSEMSYEDLETYLKSLPEGVIRAKGIVKLSGFPHPALVSYSFGSFEVLGEAKDYEGQSFMVLIGVGQSVQTVKLFTKV